ncbi:MAG: c-type cytochrome biogenesis protein CcsB [gamma proteobacterium symbiont of Lucinoma myriamae]|nr:c-type cytochrome biogenesis protein CcsB [gamma proteobacterium symbiont of Lucinoma myriamae]MCU7818547.1 c-type cytochrome biogenesis protein CcsB [gamma proteobacterium symbiont of Lucinoma myriamae]MCU7832317.1 c-type cytochrome biogenesis protein CcsB [gamma proteobacterium symbiont of Lucinoma myriamae]
MSMTSQDMNNLFEKQSFLSKLNLFDWGWAALLLLSTGYVWQQYSSLMDVYEAGILFFTSISIIAWGWLWKPVRLYSISVALLSLFAISLYGNDLALKDTNFFLKFLISGESAVMWMSALYVLATVAYFIGLIIGSEFTNKTASAMTWSATVMGLVGLLVRWRESYLIHVDVGHIPVSNLYEVFILFSIITALLYLYYEGKSKTYNMGGFVLLVISSAVAFLLWYGFGDRGASEIQPLVPALQSYWMKIHVPANFVGYGAFALSAMLGVAYLIKDSMIQHGRNGAIINRIPDLDTMDDVMYKSIALGFAFFTLATILGAMWAAEAWGSYWSWDPKETWALIVWLNYAAWLHLRLTKGWRGRPLAWWAIIGLFVTLFAFIGVNMFLSGLHSYGEL